MTCREKYGIELCEIEREESDQPRRDDRAYWMEGTLKNEMKPGT